MLMNVLTIHRSVVQTQSATTPLETTTAHAGEDTKLQTLVKK